MPWNWGPAEENSCRLLTALALVEDLGDLGDLTTHALVAEQESIAAKVVARKAGVVCGLAAGRQVLATVDPRIHYAPCAADGDRIARDAVLATIAGPARSLLAAERTFLNFVQRLSGIATLTRQFVDAVAGLPVRIYDTRKTTPGWRILEKYAVRSGGGCNHRRGLFDAVLIKDNHRVLLQRQGKRLADAVAAARAAVATGVPVILEVDQLEQLDEALFASPDVILLDNMNVEQLREAVRRRGRYTPHIPLEASGGVGLHNIRAIAETGVDRVSIGALTHSAAALDVSLDFERN